MKRWVRHGARQMVLGGLDMVLLLGVRYVVCSRGERRRGGMIVQVIAKGTRRIE